MRPASWKHLQRVAQIRSKLCQNPSNRGLSDCCEKRTVRPDSPEYRERQTHVSVLFFRQAKPDLILYVKETSFQLIRKIFIN